MNRIYYNLFLRNWKNNRATEEDINIAVDKGFISKAQGDEIKSSERLKTLNRRIFMPNSNNITFL